MEREQHVQCSLVSVPVSVFPGECARVREVVNSSPPLVIFSSAILRLNYGCHHNVLAEVSQINFLFFIFDCQCARLKKMP